jgi:hypothetical protein
MWKTIRSRGSNYIAQRIDLPHHVISVYEGDYNSWWPQNSYNISYSINRGQSSRIVLKDVIVTDIDQATAVVETLKPLFDENKLDQAESIVRQKHNVFAIGEENFRAVSIQRKPILKPYEVTVDKTTPGYQIAQVIRELMKK